MRSNLRTTALFALAACTAGLPLEAGAQRSLQAGVVASDQRAIASAAIEGSNNRSRVAAIEPARRSMKGFLIGGAMIGALVGGVLAASFNDSFCGEPAPGYSCSSTSPVAGAMIGAGVGVFAGWLVWALTNATESSLRASSR